MVRDVLRGAVLVTADISAGHQVHTFEVNSRVGPLCFVVKSARDLNHLTQSLTSSLIHIIFKALCQPLLGYRHPGWVGYRRF